MDKQTEIPIFTNTGKAAGGVTAGVFHKSVSGRRHFMRRPPGIAFDVAVLDRAKAAGAHTVMVRDKDTKKKYYASIEDVYRFGVPLDFPGWGKQICLPFYHFRNTPQEEAITQYTLTDATPLPVFGESNITQLNLFTAQG